MPSRRSRPRTAFLRFLQAVSPFAEDGPLKLNLVRERAGVSRAGPILRDNHYGWFERVERGTYMLTLRGEEELGGWRKALEERQQPPS